MQLVSAMDELWAWPVWLCLDSLMGVLALNTPQIRMQMRLIFICVLVILSQPKFFAKS